MNFLVVLPVVAVMIVLKFTRINILGWMAAWWFAIYIVLVYGIDPPMPSSIFGMFMAIVTLALLAYLSANSENLEFAKSSIIRFLTLKKFFTPLIIVTIALPTLVATRVYLNAAKQVKAPVIARTIHPPPPTEITFNGTKIDLVTSGNPYRELEETDPNGFQNHVENGRRVYYQNCVFCHGDNMRGNGIFVDGFDPIPANFADPTTIAMLQESYLFWRIAKGAPGLPVEATPWSSAMPAWEKFLSQEEIWDVILFLYDFTDQRPRAQEEH